MFGWDGEFADESHEFRRAQISIGGREALAALVLHETGELANIR